MPLLSEQLKPKTTPVAMQIVLGLEWVLTVGLVTAFVTYIWFVFVWDVLGAKDTASSRVYKGYDREGVIILSSIAIATSALSIALVAVLGKGISQRSITKCKIWMFASSFVLLALTGAYAFFLVQNYFENYCFIVATIYLGYKLLTIVAIYNFTRQLQAELQMEYRLFPAPFI